MSEINSTMTLIEICLVVFALLIAPGLARRLRVEPQPIALAAVWSMTLAVLVVLTLLTMCAAALVDSFASGEGLIPARHLVSASPISGWISLIIVAAVLLRGGEVVVKALLLRRKMRRGLQFAPVTLIDEVPVATVPTDEFLATVVPGSGGLVVMSRGALSRLTAAERRAVVHHELAHHRCRHHLHLLLARSAERAFGFVPGMRHAANTLRESIESVADDAAATSVGDQYVRSARAAALHVDDPRQASRMQTVGEPPSKLMLCTFVLSIVVVSTIAILLEASWLGING